MGTHKLGFLALETETKKFGFYTSIDQEGHVTAWEGCPVIVDENDLAGLISDFHAPPGVDRPTLKMYMRAAIRAAKNQPVKFLKIQNEVRKADCSRPGGGCSSKWKPAKNQ